MDRPRLRTALVTRGHTKALKDGTVAYDKVHRRVSVVTA